MKNIIEKKRAAMTVLLLTRVSATSGIASPEGVDIKAISKLQKMGFVGLKGENRRVSASVPEKERYLFEYDAQAVSNQKSFRILRLHGANGYSVVESGRTIYVADDQDVSQGFSASVKGNELMEWEVRCGPTPVEVAESYKQLVLYKNTIVVPQPLEMELDEEDEIEEEKHDPEPLPSPPRFEVNDAPTVKTNGVHVSTGNGSHKPEMAVPLVPSLCVLVIPTKRIRRNRDQPRKYFHKGELRKLADSIKQDGQNDPIEVIRVEGDPDADFELVKGERRWRAALMEDIPTLEAIVRDKDEIPDKETQHRLCFLADSHHAPYGKVEMALALLTEQKHGATLKQLSAICGKSIGWVATHLSLQKLDPELLKLLDPELPRKQQLSFSIALQLARIPLPQQSEVYAKISKIAGARIQILETKRLVSEILPPTQDGRKRKPGDSTRSLDVIIPRVLADTMTADLCGDEVFQSLVDNRPVEHVELILERIRMAMNNLTALENKIKIAKEIKSL